MKTRAMYGTWSSAISSGLVASTARLNDVMWAGDTLVWHESRGAQNVILSQTGNNAPRIISGSKAANGRIGYSGGMLATCGSTVAFIGTGSRIHTVQSSGGAIRTISPEFGGVGGLAISPDGVDVVYGHTYEDRDGLVLVDIDGTQFPRKLYYPGDFVMNPVWHPDGTRIALMTWDHPNMPWDGSEIHLLTLNERREVVSVECVAGGRDVSTMQPQFSPDGRYLAYISDKSGWWHIELRDLTTGTVRQLTHGEAEYGGPQWISGCRYFDFTPDSRAIVARRSEQMRHSLWHIDIETGGATPLAATARYGHIEQVSINASGRIAAIVSAPGIPTELITFSLDSDDVTVHARTVDTTFAPGVLSEPEHIDFPTSDRSTSYGLFYPPTNPRFESAGLPPVIVFMHGGPTSANAFRFEPILQFWATRGYAVFAVNFRGGTGYGRANMQMLNGRWGDIDLADAVDGVKYLAGQGRIDAGKAVIYGGSSGGYAVLQGLAAYPGVFKAGVDLYGISDLFALARDTHKFESHYNDTLLGALPDAAALWRQRSPLFFVEKITDALIVFQGADDKVVPQSQSDAMVAALRARGMPVEYHVYPGEGHGFRKPDTIDHYLQAALAFLERTVIYT